MARGGLKAGIYHNLKPTAPIVLDTGSFIFIGLVFKSHIGGFRGPGFSGLNGKEVLLDASKAREITLLNCIFQGEDQKGIAFQSVIEKTTVIQCRFSGLRVGISAKQKQAGKGKEMVSILSVTSNTFQNLRYGVWLQAGTHTLSDFRCNQFVHTLTGVNNAGVGLYIGGNLPGQAVPGLTGDIGGDGIGNNPDPSGNRWPVGGSTNSANPYPPNSFTVAGNSIDGWFSPTNWKSIVNESGINPYIYWRFANEFVGTFTNLGPALAFDVNTSNFYNKTDASQANPPGIDPSQIVVTCGNFGLVEVFPTRRAVDSLQKGSKGPDLESHQTWLNQNLPNPGAKTVSISYFVHEKANHVWLEVYDLGTGRILASQNLQSEGGGSFELSVSKFASGMYGYRLMVDGQARAWKKMAIAR